MSEKDLALKAASRRLLWSMGFSTKVDVPLRAFVPRSTAAASRSRSGHESFTDLDVLGLHVSSDLRVQSAIADCKTTAKGSTERMFWVRGVADFFEADDAYLVRSNEVAAAARQLAARLGITVLAPTDLAVLATHYRSSESNTEVGFLFDPARIANYRKTLTTLDNKLQPLRDYQEFDYWVYEQHRNLQQVIAHLQSAAKTLDAAHPAHQALFFESSWLYALALIRAAHHVRRTHASDPDTSLREYLFGGQMGLREKQALAGVLRSVAGMEGGEPNEGVFPTYFDALLELTTRFTRRPGHVGTVLRYAEWAAEAFIGREIRPASEVFGHGYDDLAAKLLADVCGFLVTAAGLSPEFRTRARQVFAPNPQAPEPKPGAATGGPAREEKLFS